MTTTVINCPLCGNTMSPDGDYYRCGHNQNHAILVKKEYDRYGNGEKNIEWLRGRMKVRFGKLVHKK